MLPAAKLLPRAWELARELALRPQPALRYARMAATAELRRLMPDRPMGHALQNLGARTTVDKDWEDVVRQRGQQTDVLRQPAASSDRSAR